MNAPICFACRAIGRSHKLSIADRHRLAVQCIRGAITGPEIAALRAELNAIEQECRPRDQLEQECTPHEGPVSR